MALQAAKRAVAATFLVNGFAYASWLSRLPSIRDSLDLSATEVGLLLLLLSCGTFVALPSSGWVVAHVGPRATVRAGGVAVTAGLLLLCAGVGLPSPVCAGGGMFLYGLGTSAWDVAMNVEAAAVERRLGRSVMPRFHAAFSLGTIVGAAVGGVSSAAGLPVTWHLVVTAALVGAAVPVATSRFITEREVPDAAGDTRRPGALAAWTERRTVAIGLVVLAFALCEGLANDWLALTMVDAYGTSETIGAATFAAFVSAMTLGRTVGGGVVDRYGRVAALRGTAVLVVLGTAAVATSPHPAGAVVGAVLWGLGASLGFPLGMTAAGEDERHAAARVSVVASIGYAAFLGGPPVAGMLADSFGFRRAVLFASVAAVAGFLTAGAARRRDTEPARTAHGQ